MPFGKLRAGPTTVPGKSAPALKLLHLLEFSTSLKWGGMGLDGGQKGENWKFVPQIVTWNL
jgi:hypothetical protein